MLTRIIQPMQVNEISEFDLIQKFSHVIQCSQDKILGKKDKLGFKLKISIGDDAAAWEAPKGTRVLTTDTMVEKVHFELPQIGWENLGWKALAVNLSDVAAMACKPLYSVVTLGLRGNLPVDGLIEMYEGMMELCANYGGTIVGGNIVRSPVFFVSIAVVGTTSSVSHPLNRHSAKPGNKIAVTGNVGCSAGGLRITQERSRLDKETFGHLHSAHNRPIPRIIEGTILSENGATSAIDISDGLTDDLMKLCVSSGVSGNIYSNQIPVDSFLKSAFPDSWLHFALSGGEDYELLFTGPAEAIEKMKQLIDIPISVIGEIVEGIPNVTVFDSNSKSIPIDTKDGWDHFK